MIWTVCNKWKTNSKKFQGLNLFIWFRINYSRNWECFDQSCGNRTESVHGTLRFLFLSHLLYRTCVKVFIMNCYTTTKNGFGWQYTERGQLYSGMLKHGSPHNLHNLAKWYSKRIVLISLSSVALTRCAIFIVEILVTWPEIIFNISIVQIKTGKRKWKSSKYS